MKLDYVFISNYKSIPVDGLRLEPSGGPLLLVGKNNSGKSNVLNALRIGLLGPSKDLDDFIFPTYWDRHRPIVVEVRLSGISVYAMGGFLSALRAPLDEPTEDEYELTVRREFHTHYSAGKNLFEPGMFPSLELTEVDSTRHRFHVVSRQATKEVEDTGLSYAWRRLVSGVYVSANRDFRSDQSPLRSNDFGQFLFSAAFDGHSDDLVGKMADKLKARILRNINRQLKGVSDFARQAALVDDVQFRSGLMIHPFRYGEELSIEVMSGGRKEFVWQMGTGTNNAIYMGMMVEYLKRQLPHSRLKVAIVEEPEAFLHPHAQRSLVKTLCDGGTAQNVFLSTHSASVAEVVETDRILRLERGSASAPTEIRRGSASMGRTRRPVGKELAELAFATRAVLVEGDSDAKLIRRVAAGMQGCDPDEHGVSIIEVGGVSNCDAVATLSESWGVVWRVLADGDVTGKPSEWNQLKKLDPSMHLTPSGKGWRGQRVWILERMEIEDYYGVKHLAGLLSIEEPMLRDRLRKVRVKITKTGKALEEATGRTKSELAILMGDWYRENPKCIPLEIRQFVRWSLLDLMR